MSKNLMGDRNGTQLIRPKNQKKTQTKTEQKKEKKQQQKMPSKGGIRIGDNTDSDKWRCRTYTQQCITCGDPKSISIKPKIQQAPKK